MRIIAGEFKGRPLKAPKGTQTRPTTDRVKESVLSALLSAYGPLEGVRVLDAFAGSGSLGIECLSRGAASAHFFERDRAALAALSDNVGMLRLPKERARIFKADVLRNPPLLGSAPYDVVLLDPPYAYEAADILAFVGALAGAGRLASDAVIVYEHASKADLAEAADACGMALDILSTKRFGGTAIDFFSLSE